MVEAVPPLKAGPIGPRRLALGEAGHPRNHTLCGNLIMASNGEMLENDSIQIDGYKRFTRRACHSMVPLLDPQVRSVGSVQPQNRFLPGGLLGGSAPPNRFWWVHGRLRRVA